METFKDKNGTVWSIELNVGSARKVKSDCGIDLLNTIAIDANGLNVNLLDALATDSYLLVSVLVSLCRKQMDERRVAEEDFYELFDGDSIQCAVDALIKEVINFFPPSKRKILSMIYEKVQSFRASAEQRLEETWKNTDLQETLATHLNEQFTSSQESLE